MIKVSRRAIIRASVRHVSRTGSAGTRNHMLPQTAGARSVFRQMNFLIGKCHDFGGALGDRLVGFGIIASIADVESSPHRRQVWTVPQSTAVNRFKVPYFSQTM